jgi:hypothetical protein
MLVDVFGVPLAAGQRVLYATAWNMFAELRVGTLLAVEPVPVVRSAVTGQPYVRPSHALAVLSEGGVVLRAEAEAWMLRQLQDLKP